jgi:hypothetical protein
MNDDYQSKTFEENDVGNLVRLYKNAFNVLFPRERILKKYFHAYQKFKCSTLTYFNKSDAVSFYGTIVQRAQLNCEFFYIAQSCDSMTAKEHGGKGLFVKLANRAYDNVKQSGINYVCGLPNKTIYELRKKKLNWKHDENINVFKAKIKTLPLAKLVKKIPFLKNAYFLYINSVLKRHLATDTFFENSMTQKDFGNIIHDQDYFDYKWGRDKFILKLNGINFWIKIDGALSVGDFENADPKSFSQAFSILKELAAKCGCDWITFHFQEGSLNDKLLRELMPISDQIPFGYLILAEYDPKIRFCAADFDTW